jgi:hypothetical protein
LTERDVGGRKGYQGLLKPLINNFLELNSEIVANSTSLEIIKPPIKRKKKISKVVLEIRYGK